MTSKLPLDPVVSIDKIASPALPVQKTRAFLSLGAMSSRINPAMFSANNSAGNTMAAGLTDHVWTIEDLLSLLGEHREAAVRGVHVEPEALGRTEIRHRLEWVHRTRVRRPGATQPAILP